MFLNGILAIIGWELGRHLFIWFKNKKTRIEMRNGDALVRFSCRDIATRERVISNFESNGWFLTK